MALSRECWHSDGRDCDESRSDKPGRAAAGPCSLRTNAVGIFGTPGAAILQGAIVRAALRLLETAHESFSTQDW